METTKKHLEGLTENEAKIYQALLDHPDDIREPGNWCCVYLDNVEGTGGISGKAFSGILGSLANKGLYRAMYEEKYFGEVWIPEEGYQP